MEPKITPSVRAYIRAITSKGGKARAAKYDHATLSAWSMRGGRPQALGPKEIRKLAKLKERGLTQPEIADRLAVSLSTVVRALRRLG